MKLTTGLAAIGIACILPLLSGCANIGNLYAPNSSFSIESDIKDLHDQYGTAANIKSYYSVLPETKDRRNEFIAARLSLYNLEYLEFISQFQLTKAQEASAFDLTTTGINLATAVSGNAGAKSVLAAVATALSTTRTSLDKNFYNQETTSALITAMNAQRKAALVPIILGMQNDPSQYPMSTAIVDLDAYQAAGTIQGALNGIQTDSSVKAAQAQSEIDQYTKYTYQPDNNTQRLKNWIWPGLVSFNPQTYLPLDASGNTITAAAANVTALQSYMAAHNLGGLAIGAFLNNGSLASARADAVSTLHVP